jgi:hypothetical protein
MSGRERWTRIFLWFTVVSSGIGLGAKIFDLVVLAAAWGAVPPESLKLMPYGEKFPVNPGDFFQPLNIFIIIPVIGALVTGWKTPKSYRMWLLLPVISLVIASVATPLLFWPIINELWFAGTGEIVKSQSELRELVGRWVILDWCRIVLVAVVFLSSIKAISMPYPRGFEQ